MENIYIRASHFSFFGAFPSFVRFYYLIKVCVLVPHTVFPIQMLKEKRLMRGSVRRNWNFLPPRQFCCFLQHAKCFDVYKTRRNGFEVIGTIWVPSAFATRRNLLIIRLNNIRKAKKKIAIFPTCYCWNFRWWCHHQKLIDFTLTPYGASFSFTIECRPDRWRHLGKNF